MLSSGVASWGDLGVGCAPRGLRPSQRDRSTNGNKNAPDMRSRMALPLTLLLEQGGHTVDEAKPGMIHAFDRKVLHSIFAESPPPIGEGDGRVAMPATRDTPPVSTVKAVMIRVIAIPKAFLEAEGDSFFIPLNNGSPVQSHPIARDVRTLHVFRGVCYIVGLEGSWLTALG